MESALCNEYMTQARQLVSDMENELLGQGRTERYYALRDIIHLQICRGSAWTNYNNSKASKDIKP